MDIGKSIKNEIKTSIFDFVNYPVIKTTQTNINTRLWDSTNVILTFQLMHITYRNINRRLFNLL